MHPLRALQGDPQRRWKLERAFGRRIRPREQFLRPDGWTSADAAGLPIFPGLVRYEEVAAGAMTAQFASPHRGRSGVMCGLPDTSPRSRMIRELPPMGTRFRLKASVDITGFAPANQVILQALKTYGMILADNGSPLVSERRPQRFLERRRASRTAATQRIGLRGRRPVAAHEQGRHRRRRASHRVNRSSRRAVCASGLRGVDKLNFMFCGVALCDRPRLRSGGSSASATTPEASKTTAGCRRRPSV